MRSLATGERTNNILSKKWREVSLSHSTMVWRDKFAASIANLTRSNLWKVTMFLTGHSTFNCTLNKYKTEKILDIQCISLFNLITRKGGGRRSPNKFPNKRPVFTAWQRKRCRCPISGQRIEM